MVKIVEVEFNIEASEETIAADNAARIRPFIPDGIKFLISQGAALPLIIFQKSSKCDALLSFF